MTTPAAWDSYPKQFPIWECSTRACGDQATLIKRISSDGVHWDGFVSACERHEDALIAAIKACTVEVQP